MQTHNQNMQILTRAERTVRVPWWLAALWLLGFVALLVVGVIFAMVPGPAIWAEGVSARLIWPVTVASILYGLLTASAAHRLETWRFAMWGKFWGPQMMFIFGMIPAAAMFWMSCFVVVPNALAFTAKEPVTFAAQLVALRGGGRPEDGRREFILNAFGYQNLPYEGQLAAPFGRFDRVPMAENLGLTAIDYGSFYTTPVPVTITGHRNRFILVIDSVTR